MVDIVDNHGRPMRASVSELTEAQTASIGSLKQDFAGHPSRGLTPVRLARILEEAERGSLLAQVDLFDDIEEKDAHVFSELSKRRRALLGLDWQIVPPRNATATEKREAEQVSEIFEELDLSEIILDMADAIGKSYSLLEITWTREGGEWMPALQLQPQRWFQLPANQPYTDELRLRNNTPDGEALQPFGWVTHLHKARPGYLARSGLGRILAWPFLFKNYSVRDLAEFLEIYGLPLRIGTYPAGASDREKATLLRAVMNIGHSAAGIIPQGMEIDFKEAAKGQADPYKVMLDWCERSESKAIVGQTLSAEAQSTGMGSGVADLQGDVRRDLMVSDAHQIAATLTRDLVFPVAMLNIATVSDRRRSPRFEFLTQESDDLKTMAAALPRLSKVMRIPAGWAYDRLQIPAPEDGEEVLGESSRAGDAVPPTPTPAKVALRSDGGQPPAAEQTVPQQQAEQLADKAAPAVHDWIDSIQQLVEKANSLEEIRDGLMDLYPDMSLDDYAAAMQKALAAAELAGRSDVLDQTRNN